MSRFFESIKIYNGTVFYPGYHNVRIKETICYHYGISKSISVEDLIVVPEPYKTGLVKCRFIYDRNEHNLEFEHYTPKIINSLKIVISDNINYSYKYADRNAINELLLSSEDCDDILIVKNGMITDTSFSNIVLFDGLNLVTPKTYLLNGVCRQRLLFDELIIEKDVFLEDLCKYSKLYLINAMRGDDFSHYVNISCVIPI